MAAIAARPQGRAVAGPAAPGAETWVVDGDDPSAGAVSDADDVGVATVPLAGVVSTGARRTRNVVRLETAWPSSLTTRKDTV